MLLRIDTNKGLAIGYDDYTPAGIILDVCPAFLNEEPDCAGQLVRPVISVYWQRPRGQLETGETIVTRVGYTVEDAIFTNDEEFVIQASVIDSQHVSRISVSTAESMKNNRDLSKLRTRLFDAAFCKVDV